MIHTSRTQATVALSSGEAELYAIGQGTSEELFLKSLILEAEFAKRVNMIVYTDSTAGRSMAIRFGAGKKTGFGALWRADCSEGTHVSEPSRCIDEVFAD